MDLPDLVLQPAAGAFRLKLRVVPGARRDAILGGHGEALRVAVRAIAEKGRANDAVTALLATALELPAGSIALVAGRSGRDKIVEVRGLEAGQLRARLAIAADPGRRPR